jgi:putative ABC transport system substrate-binding protein
MTNLAAKDNYPVARMPIPGQRAMLVAVVLMLLPNTAPVLARQDGKPVIGVLDFHEKGCRSEPFIAGLRDLGYVEGKTMIIDCQYNHDGGYLGLDQAAKDLVQRKPDVIAVFGHATSLAMKRATQTIPVVMSTSGEPVAIGMVQSLARPGGNITGVSYYNAELNAKRLELLKAVKPSIKRVALVTDPTAPPDLIDIYTHHTLEAARTLGLEAVTYNIRPLPELEAMVKDMARDRVDAIYVMPFQATLEEIRGFADLAKKYKLPTTHFSQRFVAAGGLMSYGVDYAAQRRRMATYVDKILKGAKPAELPIEQPARFQLTLNMATAKALGLQLPESVLLRADKVIE